MSNSQDLFSSLACTLALLTNHRNVFWKANLICCPDLFCDEFFSWCYVPTTTVNWHIKATSWHRLYDILTCYRQTQIKRTLLPKLLFRVAATSQGSMTIFSQLCQTCSINQTVFHFTLRCWSLKTQFFLPCTNVLCNQIGSNDSSVFCRDIIIYYACMLPSMRESKSHRDL